MASVSYELSAYKQFLQLICLCIVLIKPLARNLVSIQGVQANSTTQSHTRLLFMTYGGEKFFCTKCIIITQHILLASTLVISSPLAVIHVLSSTVINCS